MGGGVRYDAHLPVLSFWDEENSQTLLCGMVLLTLQGHFLCKNWTSAGYVGSTAIVKKFTPTPPWRWRPPSPGCSKQPRGNDMSV